MIGGAWHPAGVAEARALLRALSELEPVASFEARGRGAAVVAAWGRARHARAARAVCLGEALPLLGRLDFDAARGLRGTYALLAATEEGLVLAKGVLGGHALYLRRLPGGAVVACSRASALRALGPVTPDLDAVAAFVASVPAATDATVLREIARVRTCEVLLEGERARRASRHVPAIAPFEGGADDAADALFSTLRERVGAQIAGAGRVAVLTGGGVDSSALLAAVTLEAAARGLAPPLAVTLDFDGPGSDRPHFTTLVEALGATAVRVPPRQSGPWLERALVLGGLPYVGACYDVGVLVAAAAHGADAAVTGNFGDELFEGPLRALSMEVGLVKGARRAAALELPWPTTALDRVAELVLLPRAKPLVPRWLRGLRGRRAHSKLMPWAGPRTRAALASRRTALAEAVSVPSNPQERYVHFAHDVRWSEVAEARAQVEEETGCPRLEPFQDDALVELVASFPVSLLTHGDLHRGLLRHALRGRVPDSVRLRRDKAWFEVALAEAARAGGGLEALSDLASFERLSRAGVVDAPALRADFDRLRGEDAGDAALGEAWSFVSLALAAERFLALEEGARPSARRLDAAEIVGRPVSWVADARAGDRLHMRVGRAGTDHVAEWPGLMVLVVPPEGEPEARPAPGADPRTVARLQRGLGAALVRQARGGFSLHAAVVARGGHALALVGESGAGKSSAAAALCAFHGCELLCDDIAPLALDHDGVDVLAADGAHSLDARAAAVLGLAVTSRQADGKLSAAARGAHRPARLAAIVNLCVAERGPPSLERMRGGQALACLVDGVVRLVVDDPELQKRELVLLDRLCSMVPVWELSRPGDLSALRESVAPVAALLPP